MDSSDDDRWRRFPRPLLVIAVLAVGLTAVVALTALQASVGPGWIALSARIGSGIVAVATGLVVNRITRRPRGRP
ncbi:hypothetical protein [Curtobacterium pusillum]|uniref:hypothetical protein n=1 Tax=Curtobacterium pusillum TaxID=69373 RepID=UPI0011A946E0|nr:hypothetical protein [Curtobacterium pusillum]